MSFERTIKALQRQESSHWDIAEALVAEVTSSRRDWDDLAEALSRAGIDYKVSTLRTYRRVALGFPAEDRVDGASFAAHQAALTVGSPMDARTALHRAAADGKPTRERVLAEVRLMKGRTQTSVSDAVAAWRDLRRGVERLLAVDPAELDALMLMSSGTHAAEAVTLSQRLAEVSLLISEARAKAEAKIAQQQRGNKPASRKATPQAAPAAPATAPNKPKVGRLGQGRGLG